ncbi:18_t:CDS:2 [Cetraspora pellucida]|uniref:18_t:CDS:1 n=1 Tax=Cetraspora pellucida TaxID=1433469 RepID=A0ACA9L7T7_9GLOM|nr:18_t:CDS:2 [Cetraspora pellucida]
MPYLFILLVTSLKTQLEYRIQFSTWSGVIQNSQFETSAVLFDKNLNVGQKF